MYISVNLLLLLSAVPALTLPTMNIAQEAAVSLTEDPTTSQPSTTTPVLGEPSTVPSGIDVDGCIYKRACDKRDTQGCIYRRACDKKRDEAGCINKRACDKRDTTQGCINKRACDKKRDEAGCINKRTCDQKADPGCINSNPPRSCD